MKVDNSSIESAEELKYLGTRLTNQNSIQEEIKSRLKLENACYHSVQNILSSSLLSKNLKINVYVTIKLYVYIYFNYSKSTTVLLVYIMFIIYNIRATSFGFMPSSDPL